MPQQVKVGFFNRQIDKLFSKENQERFKKTRSIMDVSSITESSFNTSLITSVGVIGIAAIISIIVLLAVTLFTSATWVTFVVGFVITWLIATFGSRFAIIAVHDHYGIK